MIGRKLIFKISKLARAIEIAVSAHKGQRDKSGAECILHLLSFMDIGKTTAVSETWYMGIFQVVMLSCTL